MITQLSIDSQANNTKRLEQINHTEMNQKNSYQCSKVNPCLLS